MIRTPYFLRLGTMLSLLLVASLAFSQEARDKALRFLRENPARFNLSPADVADVKIIREYTSEHNGITHVWFQQQHLGIPLYNGLFALYVTKSGEVLHRGHRFQPDLGRKVNTTMPSLSARQALEIAVNELGFSGFSIPALKTKTNDRNLIFEGGAISRSDIPVSATYEATEKGTIRLAWSMMIDQANTSDYWILNVDAQTGKIIGRQNLTVYCQAGHPHRLGEDADQCDGLNHDNPDPAPPAAPPAAAESYRVFAWPLESPAHGARTLEVNPADAVASPFGWHDVNGQAGAEYTYSRGNNTWAFDDSSNDNTPAVGESIDGGPTYTFDFPFNPDAEPIDNLPASITNLFYTTNKMHDVTYRLGFNEGAGNFQTRNYSGQGVGNDAVLAQALDGSGENNANFATPPDGSPGRMQMYTWTRQGGRIVTVNGPGAILGSYNGRTTDNWGKPITTTPVTGDVVVINDGSADPTLGCFDAVDNLSGKIAMIDRGECEFGAKALKAQQAGAIGCIICNFENSTILMGPGAVGGQVTIPVVMMEKKDCDLLRQYAGVNLNISLVTPPVSGPNNLDGSFDNGIINHEYGHGVSNRLTGNGFSCLGNLEQMGEGWSDWFTLVNGVRAGDVAAQRRGVGTFVMRQNNDGVGIRRYPYSTDMSINPLTYGSVAQTPDTSQVHPRGEVWAAVTWDLYWAMVAKYGYDADLNNTNSGNFRAMRLVVDGLSFQPCSPGFIDGRDGIMMADMANYAGVDTCLIMDVFARRGMGINADQGSPLNAGDGIENFDPIPTCVKELKISKVCTPTINPGEEAEFTITITNHKDETAASVVLSDIIPDDLTFISASNGGTFANNQVSWNLGNMPTLDVKTVTYKVRFAAGAGSTRIFRDSMDTNDNWLALFTEGESAFDLQSTTVKVGQKAWFAPAGITVTDMTLEYFVDPIQVSGTQPVLRFWHNYNTEKSADAGFLEIRIDGEQAWRRPAATKVFRGEYTGNVQYGTFAIPFLSGYSGNSEGWVQSYFDLSEYKDKSVYIRFRFGTDDNTAVPNGGWYVDEVEVIDMLNFNTTATVTDASGSIASTDAPGRGLVINPGFFLSSKDAPALQLPVTVQPNPADEFLRITAQETLVGAVQVSLIGMDGRVALQQQKEGLFAAQALQLNISELPAGVYTLHLQNAAGTFVQKVVVK